MLKLVPLEPDPFELAVRHHAQERAALHRAQPARLCSSAIGGRQRARRNDAQIRADQAGRLLLQCQPHAVGEQPYGREAAHREHQRQQQQHAPLPCTPVAAQQVEREAEEVHFLFKENRRQLLIRQQPCKCIVVSIVWSGIEVLLDHSLTLGYLFHL